MALPGSARKCVNYKRVHSNSPGRCFGSTAGWDDFETYAVDLLESAGGVTYHLYLTFDGDDGYLSDVESFQFNDQE